MDNPQKFSNSKEVINFLVEQFPTCFSNKGDAKPLKIGIFQDLAERLANEERVSKTLLRSSLRHYTNSWRYLHSIKKGAQRIDLDGNDVAAIEDEHVEHAKKQLDESKAKVAEKRKEQKADGADVKNTYKKKDAPKFKPTSKVVKKEQTKVKQPPAERLEQQHIVEGTAVTVKIGKSPMPATIIDVSKDGIQVQLDTGMVVKVQLENLRLARSKR
ncbi:RNA chaperone ProQ [Paraglaciecola arctica]|uniref:RNA chaperone ProQ n=1 Tax=Paraglaciecola arctica BSs20135 TaxID=493475 RepID=K6YL73_9ALTE|nr:RNA chaperone ProQ [Paraglaciecola arctica]GAC17353.1 ProP effector [Paraglaciecola arctica BSs20135]|tara:strand:+ start:1033 stop:1677 length:645 start_codon:yes stop_codon:yes gene_type:complete